MAILLAASACFPKSAAAYCEKQPIDVLHSQMKIHVGKAGLFSAFGHDHEISAPIADGSIQNCEAPSVALRIEAGKLRVVDPGEPEKTRASIEQTMLGPQVLDSNRFPEIKFESTSVEDFDAGPAAIFVGKTFGRLRVHGNLTLHGQTRPMSVEVTLANGRYRGEAVIKQRDFVITPVSLFGGSVRVKNEVRIEFEISAGS